MMMKNDSGTCGIYKITRKDTGQAYIGLSENIERRWYDHTHSPQLKHSYIDRAIKKYGADRFDLEIIEELPNDRDLLTEREAYWVKYYNTYKDDFHYNLTPAGDFSPMKVPEIAAKVSKANSGKNNPMFGKIGEEHPSYGYKHTPEAKEKMSKANSGENNPFYGKKHSEKARKKISKAHKGKKLSEETKKKMSEAKSGENHPMFGKKGEESPNFGRKHTPEAKAKISKALSGKKRSEETRKKISKALSGKKRSEDVKKRCLKLKIRLVIIVLVNAKTTDINKAFDTFTNIMTMTRNDINFTAFL